ncbi:unnamed protein product [Lathyrus sativus]|nr:unnamed protein product [Lathyrus sativus]
MGEEVKQEPPKEESKPEETPVEEKKEEQPEEEKEPKPPSPCVLFVDLHCMGCAKKIEKYIMKIRGVEGVLIDMAKNEVLIKGIVEPQAICNIITKKTKRMSKVISPLPEAEGEPIPEVVTSQVSEPVTVELNVKMHCEACAEQLKGKILKMKGVQKVETDLSTGKVTVTGTMDANNLVEYVYRRTKKQAKIVPQPEPEPEPEKKEEEKPAEAEEAKPEEKKEEGGEEDSKNESKEVENGVDDEEGMMKRMMYYNYYQPYYVVERMPPPPQLFSDENPNACCIS